MIRKALPTNTRGVIIEVVPLFLVGTCSHTINFRQFDPWLYCCFYRVMSDLSPTTTVVPAII